MLSRAITPKRRGRRPLAALAALSVVTGLLLGGGTVLAVHDAGVFELDANADNEAALGVDWDVIFAQAPSCAGADACSFTSEAANTTIFTGGGSKDDLDTTGWKHKNGSVPDKNDLADAYAVRYTVAGYDPDGTGPLLPPSSILYFGADRTSNDGDAFMGFWFFQGNITALANGTFGPAAHQDGDILVISDFSGGGDTVSLAVYQWNGPGGSLPGSGAINGTIDTLIPFGSADCAQIGGGDPACMTVNDVTTNSPWPFLDKGGSTDFRQGEFIEGGINLSFLGLADTCFSSFLAETRSSTSVNAVLKDFVGGQFAVCNATMTTLASSNGTVAPGTSVTDTATIDGSSASNDPTGTVTFFLCGPIATGDCATGGTNIGTGSLTGDSAGTSTATSPAVNTSGSPLSPGRYCFRAEWPGDANYTTPLSHTNSTTECFSVQDTSAITTAQSWLPQDSATVTLGSGGTPSGTVEFSLYNNGTCSGTAAATFTDTSAPYETNNSTYRTTSTIISWSATFTPTDTTGVAGSTTTRCERSDLTINNSASDFPPAP